MLEATRLHYLETNFRELHNRKFMKKLFTTIFFLAFSALILVVPVFSQTKEQKREQKVFAAIPENLRIRLVERLNLYIEYERTKQFDKLYDLLRESVTDTKGLNRDSYVNGTKKTIAEGYRSVLLKFKPISTLDITFADEVVATYQIFGTAKVRKGKNDYEITAGIDARWINEEWYFSGVGIVEDN